MPSEADIFGLWRDYRLYYSPNKCMVVIVEYFGIVANVAGEVKPWYMACWLSINDDFYAIAKRRRSGLVLY